MPADNFAQMLELEVLSPHHYRGRNLESRSGVVFGGQLLAQALIAAGLSCQELQLKSMHTVFLRAGRSDQDVEIDVTPLHSGRTFGGADVAIRQGDRVCTKSVVLFHAPNETFISHQDPAPVTFAPLKGSETAEAIGKGWDVRISDGANIADPEALGPPELLVWSRFLEMPPVPCASQALLAYASDGFLIGTAMRPHPGVGQDLAHVSIDTTVVTQTLTFHDDFNAAEWLLLAHRSPFAGHGRTFGRADVFTGDGRLVASYCQENMVRAMAER
jgi:acyl-CoA thioesterase